MQAVGIRVLSTLALLAPLPGQSLQALVNEAEAGGIVTSLVVRDLDSGRDLFRHRPDRPMIPASNQKLLSAAALWSGLGPDYEFQTRFELTSGNLVVHSGGDPNLLVDSEYGPTAMFKQVLEALAAADQHSLRSIDLQAGAYTGPGRPEGWPQNQLDRSYCAPTGAFVLEAGCFRVRVYPGDASRARIQVLAPPAVMPIEGKIDLSNDKRKGSRFNLVERGGSLRASGSYYRKGQGLTVTAAVREPELLYRRALQSSLEAAGVSISPAAPSRDTELTVWRSPLNLALRASLKDSSNFHAEQCLRVLGAEKRVDGSLAGGVLAMRDQLTRLMGKLPDYLQLVDGSGLSRGNRVSAAFLVELIDRVLSAPYAQLFLGSLAQGGVDGTLEKRFKGALKGKVRAKTGTINGVSCLSGVVQVGPGKIRVFSILMNYPLKAQRGRPSPRRMQDKMVAAMLRLEG
jgi:D-alanyl-D-alanine carboxypeptidase/D-alanyl-D-alanine-endopeptidase (penicillin-binding protein 4)